MSNVKQGDYVFVHITTREQFEPWRQQWDEFLHRTEANTPYYSSSWIVSYLNAFSHDKAIQPALVLCLDNERSLCSALAYECVTERPYGVPLRILRLLGNTNYLCDYCEIPAPTLELVQACLEETLRLCSPDRFELRNIRAGSLTAAHLRRLSFEFFSPYSAPAVQFRDNDTVLEKLLRKKSLRRHINKLRRQGSVQLISISSVATLNHHLPTFFEQHRRRWEHKNIPSPLTQDAQQVFFRTLGEELLKREQLCFDVLELDGRPVAYHFGHQAGATIFWYKPSFEPELASLSPGEVLLYLLFEKYGSTHDVFDFTIGDEAFKQRFANSTQSILWFSQEVSFRARLVHALGKLRATLGWLCRNCKGIFRKFRSR